MAATKSSETTVKTDVKSLNIQGKILEIQTRLFVPKGQKNDFGGYNYRSCEDIEKQLKPLLLEYNCTLLLQTAIEEVGSRLFVKATATLYDNDDDKCVSVTAYAELGEGKKGMDQAQLTGAATSYARKYALAGLFLIDNEKDADATNKHNKDGAEVITDEKGKPIISDATGEPITTVSAQQINAINAELERTGISAEAILALVKKKGLHELTQEEYVKVMNKLKISSDK